MAKYDFDQLIPRRGTNSVKWDEEPAADILPMWVADMDFRTAPCVVEALRRRVEHGVYGYATVPESYYGAVTSWFARRHGWAPGADWILPVTGVIPALSAILRALTRPGDRVLVLTPVYNHFFIAIDNSGCSAAECELTYGDNRYTVDFDALERRAADPAVKLMLLCNPHNPAGRVWTPEELRRIGDICLRRDILVVADEIHCELVMPGFRYTPFASLSEEFARRSVTCASPSKAFNLAGVQVANIFAADAGLHGRRRVARRAQRLPVGKLPFPAGLLRAASSAVPGASAGRNLPRLGRLPGRGAVVRHAHPTAAGRRPPARQLRVHVRRRGRRLHPPEHRLPAQTAGRGSRPPEKGSDNLKNGWLSEKYCYLCTS